MRCIRLLAIGAALFAVPGLAGEPGFHTQFIGGTVTEISPKSSMRLDLSSTDTLVLRNGKQEFRVPYGRVNSIEYGQNVSRRYAAAILISPVLLLSKSRKHFVTVGYADESGAQQALVFRVQKGDIRSVLASLEARTGRRVEYQDNEARKAGQ